jgi:hypothetical protein
MRSRFAAAILCALIAVSCGGIVDPSQNQTDQFAGTVTVLGLDAKQFSASKSGEYFITLLSMTPPLPSSNASVAVALTLFTTQGCSLSPIQINQFARVGAQALSGSITAGNYCVVIQDIGFMTTTSNYTIQVQHP